MTRKGEGEGARKTVSGWLHGRGGRGRGRERAPDRDGGFATVWVAMTTATLCAVFAVVLALGQVVVARHRAGGAADLAALAAADRALLGPKEACGAAEEVAEAQGAVVVLCMVRGEIADVTAGVRFGPYEPTVRSRAGPPAGVHDSPEPLPPVAPEAAAPQRGAAPPP